MDNEKRPVQSVISSLRETGPLTSFADQKIDRQKAQQLSTLLRRLAVAFYSPDFTQEQASVVIADYILDLGGFAIVDVEDAIRAYRRDPKAQFFPKPGILYSLAAAAQKERRESERHRAAKSPQFGEGRPIMWWTQPRKFWKPHWRESDVPAGHMVRDVETGKLRAPEAMA